MNIFEIYTLKVKPETPLLYVLTILVCVGVMVDGRYDVTAKSDGTWISYYATGFQQMLIDEMVSKNLEKMKDSTFEDILDDIFNKYT